MDSYGRGNPSEKRKVDSSILSLTTTPGSSCQPSHLRKRAEERGLMSTHEAVAEISHLRERWPAESCAAADPQEERKTMAIAEPCSRSCKQLDAGVFQPEIGSFRLHLAAEGKAAKTIRNYAEAVQWFAAPCLRRQTLRTRWEQVDGQDVERWMVYLLGRYSQAYASNQYRALQQFLK